MIRLYLLSGIFTSSPWVADAATGGGATFGLDTIVQTGVTGSLAGVLLLFAKTAYARETARADRLEAKLDELNEAVLTRYVSGLTDAARAVSDATRAVSDATAALSQR